MTSAITDFTQYQRMQLGADANDPAVLREVAGQFESLFLEILLKDMRRASLGDPIFGNGNQHDMYREMLDKQLAVEMSKDRGIGLADMLVRQLGGESGAAPAPGGQSYGITRMPRPGNRGAEAPPAEFGGAQATGRLPGNDNGMTVPMAGWSGPADFASAVWPHAERAGRRLGIAPESLLAQAALETGWGKHVMQRPDGGSSLNLFGIKAGPDWDGASVARQTLEYRDGVARREVARFRAYPDLGAAFDDYVAFIGTRPRYAEVVGSGADPARFGSALQGAGYATDPDYARKIARVASGDEMAAIVSKLKNGGPPPINRMMPQANRL